MFATTLLIAVVVCTMVQVGGRKRPRSAILGFLAALSVSLFFLMQSGHWDFGNPSYYGSVVAATLLGSAAAFVAFYWYDRVRSRRRNGR
jgi:putative flippase GtrA